MVVYTADHALVFLLGCGKSRTGRLAAGDLGLREPEGALRGVSNYLVSTHIGLMFLVAAFMVLYTHFGGSWELGQLRLLAAGQPGWTNPGSSCCW